MPASDADLVARHLDPDGRLVSMPVKHQRRVLVLRHVVEVIPIGVELDEFTVNNLLRTLHDDVAMLRRSLVDERLLGRPRPGRYVRPECTTPDADSSEAGMIEA